MKKQITPNKNYPIYAPISHICPYIGVGIYDEKGHIYKNILNFQITNFVHSVHKINKRRIYT